MGKCVSVFQNCLYFTASSLARAVNRLAEETFGALGFSPSHAFILMYVNEHPGAPQKELAEQMNLAPSTVTRFVDWLVNKGLVERQTEGKITRVFATADGLQLQPELQAAWQRLFQRYAAVLGEEQSRSLTRMIGSAALDLEK
ncbi:MarR family transcriptional regulator [bacterium]|nr:MarR family transcriptional regulator [bacterium]